ncbi:hypothetical protein FB45DRAFT_1057531 [Roridomyces roridus]|uniref:Histone H1 n=1 Tax=Roridomyces roridus TaxID=1738132 RepID=A0AAD7BW46_9AGAR|nr:hypothetical protein FB45DRAFT_1057531 [Roridomyces roridus]
MTKTTTKSRKAADHPTWKEIIQECITTEPRQGVSRSFIKKYAEEQYQLSGPASVNQLKRAITSGVESGLFVMPKGPSGRIKLAPSTCTKENAKPKPVSKKKPASGSKTKKGRATTKA